MACKILDLPHGPIGSCSDLLQVPVPLRNFPCGSVDLLPVKSRARAHSHETPPTTDNQAEGQDVAPCYHVNKLGFILSKDTSSVRAQTPLHEPAHHSSTLRGLHLHPQHKHIHSHIVGHGSRRPGQPMDLSTIWLRMPQNICPSSGHTLPAVLQLLL